MCFVRSVLEFLEDLRYRLLERVDSSPLCVRRIEPLSVGIIHEMTLPEGKVFSLLIGVLPDRVPIAIWTL